MIVPVLPQPALHVQTHTGRIMDLVCLSVRLSVCCLFQPALPVQPNISTHSITHHSNTPHYESFSSVCSSVCLSVPYMLPAWIWKVYKSQHQCKLSTEQCKCQILVWNLTHSKQLHQLKSDITQRYHFSQCNNPYLCTMPLNRPILSIPRRL